MADKNIVMRGDEWSVLCQILEGKCFTGIGPGGFMSVYIRGGGAGRNRTRGATTKSN
jgi:hypothetical protein